MTSTATRPPRFSTGPVRGDREMRDACAAGHAVGGRGPAAFGPAFGPASGTMDGPASGTANGGRRQAGRKERTGQFGCDGGSHSAGGGVR